MFKKTKKNLYLFMAKNKLFYSILFKLLEKNKYLERNFHEIIKGYQSKSKDFFFIQIGANDGIKFDPTYLYVKKYGWSGILVEPVNYLFKELKSSYKGVPGLSFENVAIGNKIGYKNFYMLSKSGENLPLWYDEIGSFFKSNVLKHKDRIKDIHKRVIVKKIKVLTLDSLLKKHNVKKIDLLEIDTEGYDYNILKQIPFSKIKPSIIIFENRHLSNNQKEEAKKLLLNNGYSIIQGVDCMAYLNNLKF